MSQIYTDDELDKLGRKGLVNFFKPEDFDDIPINDTWDTSIVAGRANAKLEREGKVVFQYQSDNLIWKEYTNPLLALAPDSQNRNRALLINIEPFEKCTHPKDKIRQMNWVEPIEVEGFNPGLNLDNIIFKCDCGAKVVPSAFEEAK